jgi:hypothetical protein
VVVDGRRAGRTKVVRFIGVRRGNPAEGGIAVMAGKSRRGFASMDPARQREIASRGGRAAHEKGTAHQWSPDEARVAGRKGGEVVSRDREHMSMIGREGGEARGRNSSREKADGSLADRESMLEVTREGIPAGAARASEPSATVPDERASLQT